MRGGSWNSLGERVGIASEQRGGMRGGELEFFRCKGRHC